MTRTRVVSCVALTLALTGFAGFAGFAGLLQASPAAQSKSMILATIREWTDAVVHHTPGTTDPAVRTVWDLTPDARKVLEDHLTSLLKVLNGRPVAFEWSEESMIAEGLAQQMTATMFLERAAMLHADAAMLDRRPPPIAPTAGPSGPTHPPSGIATDTLVMTRDGEIVGTFAGNWNWPFARALLDRITPSQSNEPFVAIWYHATTAYMFRGAQFGEATSHLTHAAIVLPNDPYILFDRGCLSEVQAMSDAQQALINNPAGQFLKESTGGGVGVGRAAQPIGLPTADEGNARAAGLFQHALAIDPDLVDARVRLARVLTLGKHYADADQQIRIALTVSLDREVAFLACLFGTRAANGLGHTDDAEARVQAALKLYPHAGSAILAASQTALLRADAASAISRLDGLADPSVDAGTQIDPWWKYPYGMGQIADRAISALWRSIPPIVAKGARP